MTSQDTAGPILHLTLHREHFAAIASGAKKTEYRARTRYWCRRIRGRSYRAILFRNGYGSSRPEMLVEFRGVREVTGRNAHFAISLGRILEIRRWQATS